MENKLFHYAPVGRLVERKRHLMVFGFNDTTFQLHDGKSDTMKS